MSLSGHNGLQHWCDCLLTLEKRADDRVKCAFWEIEVMDT